MVKKLKREPILPNYDLGNIELEIEDLQDKICTLESKYVKLATELINKELGEDSKYEPYELAFGPHECQNPTARCVYDSQNDPGHDDCLFCHGPRERK